MPKSSRPAAGFSCGRRLKITSGWHRRATRQPTATPGQQVYTLTLEGMKLETFLAQLEQKLSLSFNLDPEVKLDAPVNVDVKNATLDELLRTAFAPLGLEFSRKDKAVAVHAKGN